MSSPEPWVLQICHGYDGPFLDCARQYASLFVGTRYKVMTVYLTGAADAEVVAGSASDEVVFLGYGSRDMRGLKVRAIRDVSRLARSRDFKLCIAHRFKSTYIACLGTGLPVIGVNHAFGVYQRLSRRFFANVFRQRLLLLGVSDAVRDDIRNNLAGWSQERILSLYNRIDIAQAQARVIPREGARQALGLPCDAWVVGNVGRLHADKDQATLLRAFAAALPQLPSNSVLVICGKGRLEVSLKALSAELGIAERTLFLGQVPDARRFFQAFDVFALSSDHEPFGMVLLEAMAAGVPLISTDCGGAREVVKDVGVLFPLGDSAALAESLVKLSTLSVEQVRQCRLAMSQRLQERFSDSAVQQRFWALPFTSHFH
ncbi:glycosyltransferase [Phytopseudomonas daroniae]|uniref:glycosyltransferase n=1 Tax=Phytopseudomonas daroniae TaxID=2487519 RepID=UPI0010383112|nr:glycosyltransferase [Pseudomonas daroniae]TBU79087.1 glycosyltransferase [Pseudomonas daroniae]